MDGCLNSVKSINASGVSMNVGRHFGSSIPVEAFANETRQSSSAITRTAFNHSVRSLSNSMRRVLKNARLATKWRSRASCSARILGAVSGVIHLAIFYKDQHSSREIAGTYTSSRLFGPITWNLGLDGNFDIVDIFPTLSRVPKLGFGATIISKIYKWPIIKDSLDILPSFP